ncbi:MAG: hypothetical protein ACHQT9_00665 [Candidatus Saccharimonadales bacterium]
MKIQIEEYTDKTHKNNHPQPSRGFISDFAATPPHNEEGTPIKVKRTTANKSVTPIQTLNFETALDMSLPVDSSLKRDDMRSMSRMFLIACGITIASIGGQYLFVEYNNNSWDIFITVFSAMIFVLGSVVTLSYCIPFVWRKIR